MQMLRAVMVGVVVVSALASCGRTQSVHVKSVGIISSVIATDAPVAARANRGDSFRLSALASALPGSFPPDPRQSCEGGPIVRVGFTSGTTRRYGPCVLPQSIDKLRLAFVKAAVAHQSPETDGAPLEAPRTAWQTVFGDWYVNGKFDRWHPCAAVQEAIKHLAVDGPTYSAVSQDLDAYKRDVC